MSTQLPNPNDSSPVPGAALPDDATQPVAVPVAPPTPVAPVAPAAPGWTGWAPPEPPPAAGGTWAPAQAPTPSPAPAWQAQVPAQSPAPGWHAQAPAASSAPAWQPQAPAASPAPAWHTQAPVPQAAPAWAAPAAPAPQRQAATRRGVTPGILAAAVLGTAVLTAGGTYLAVTAAPGGLGDATPAGVTADATAAPDATTPAETTPAPVAQGSIVDIVKAVSPAVVTIQAEGVTASDPITGMAGQGTSVGSGVIFDADGLVLTNRHVVAGDPQQLTVVLKDGRSLDAEIYGIDTMTDLAIVKVDATDLPTAPIGDSDTIEPGQQAIAIGSPLGEFTDSVTSGIVSAIGRSIEVEDGVLSNLIQTDTAINPGNSGGPLLDATGHVIGINTAVAGGSQGIGFAIPIDIARPLLEQASAGQPLARAWLGVRFETIDPALQAEASLPVAKGAWLPEIDPAMANGLDVPADVVVSGGPAEQAGLRAGDIITAVDGIALDATHTLDLLVGQKAPGTSTAFTVLRDGAELTLTVTLGTRPQAI